MKQRDILTIAAATILLCSCINDEIEVKHNSANEMPQLIQISTSMDTDSKTRAAANLQSTTLDFATSRKAGVYVYRTTKTEVTGSYGYENIEVTGVSSSTLSTASSMVFPTDKEAIDAYVFAPRTGVTATSVSSMAITVKEDQSGNDNYLASDFVYGKTASAVEYGETASVKLKHALTKLLFNTQAGTGITTAQLSTILNGSEIVIKGINTTATVNMTNGNVSASGSGNVKAWSQGGVGNNCIIPPQTTATAAKLSIKINGEEREIDFGNQKFDSGKSYLVRITIGVKALTVKVTGIDDWISGTEITKNIEI